MQILNMDIQTKRGGPLIKVIESARLVTATEKSSNNSFNHD